MLFTVDPLEFHACKCGPAKATGIEFEYRQNLNFLPKWERGSNVFANSPFYPQPTAGRHTCRRAAEQ